MTAFPERPPLILASTSSARQSLLRGAVPSFTAEAADIDERALEAEIEGASPSDVALALAKAKALSVSQHRPGAIVIGADQTLSLGNRTFHKPASSQHARGQLLALRGATHRLNSGVALARDGEIAYAHVETAEMTMRPFTEVFLDQYLMIAGDRVLTSVGCYQLEGPGIQLFERIDGDYFTILGLPLMPLLAALRSLGVLDD